LKSRTGKITKIFNIIRYNGLGLCLFRTQYILRKKSGILKRKFHARLWSEITLADFLKQSVRSLPESFLQSHKANNRQFFFENSNLPKPDESYKEKISSQADEIINNRFCYFFDISHNLGQGPDWFLHPVTNVRVASQSHWTEVKTFDPDVGDIKFIWEPSRFAWVYVLVRAFAATGDNKYVEKFWNLFESWLKANQPNTGPNYSCGQECSIRAMAMCFAFYAFGSAKASTNERKIKLITAIVVHADRVDKNIDFAISTRTNHSLTEAAGIYTVGMLFPEFRDSEKWLKRGKKILTEEGLKQIYPDGSYIQHSMNYHRLMLQDFLWVLRLAELNNDEFCDKLILRVTKAVEFLYQMQDDKDGRVPNYGANDGALILPLNGCDYLDYRPVVQSCWYLLNRQKLYEEGPWDEDMLWLFGPDSIKTPVASVKRESKEFPIGGYYTLRSRKSWAMIRCHSYVDRVSHIDPLHVDVWADGINLLRDCGSYKYYAPDEPEYENYFKSIRSHNTVTVGGTSPLELVSRFTWLPWPKAELIGYITEGDRIHWEGQHFAYNRSPWNVIHSRSVTVENDRWEITDTLKGKDNHMLELRWHLPSEAEQLSGDNKSIKLQLSKDWIMEISGPTGLTFRQIKGKDEGGWESCYYGAKSPICTMSAAKECQLPMEFKTIVYKRV
jgi:Heparinase II/III-like protein/Heparinase II/III N-terminus